MKHLAPRRGTLLPVGRKKATFTLCEKNWRIETWFWTTPRQSHTVRDRVDKLNYVFSLDTFELTDHGLGERLSLVPCAHKKSTPMKCLDGKQGFSFSLCSRLAGHLTLMSSPSCEGPSPVTFQLQSLWLSVSFIAHCCRRPWLDIIHHRHHGWQARFKLVYEMQTQNK